MDISLNIIKLVSKCLFCKNTSFIILDKIAMHSDRSDDLKRAGDEAVYIIRNYIPFPTYN